MPSKLASHSLASHPLTLSLASFHSIARTLALLIINITINQPNNMQPQTDLELDIVGVLKESGIDENKIKQFQLQLNKISEDQVQARMDQLAKMRQLLFYQERKNKRRNKIKSKDFHKRMKKAKEKKALKEQEKALLDPTLANQLQEEQEIKRIKV